MNVQSTTSVDSLLGAASNINPSQPSHEQLEAREVFQKFVTGSFYKQMLKSLRSSQGEPAYFHGGSAEKIFQGQMDQQIAEDLSIQEGNTFSDSLYELFALQLKRQSHGPSPAQPVPAAASSEQSGSALDIRA